jgi:hypothetical protein
MIPIDDVLEALDLSRAEPGVGFLQALFERFNSRVPFENASKIARDATVADRNEKPRRPAIFWSDHLERGAGGTCFARVAAMEALLTGLGFPARKVLGRVERDFDHAALMVGDGAQTWICDVGFPLPALVAPAAGRIETALMDLDVSATPRGHRVEFREGVPEGPRGVEIFAQEVPDEEFLERWRMTFSPGSRFLSEIVLRRQDGVRVVSYARGEVRVDDRHCRLRVPLAPPRASRLSELFGVDATLLADATLRVPDRDALEPHGSLAAYLETAASPQAAFSALSSPSAYRRFVEGIAAVESVTELPGGWRLTLAPPAGQQGAGPITEEVAAISDRRALKIRRLGAGRSVDSELRAEDRGGRTYLIREAFFQAPREDLLRNDSLRGRLAGSLAVDLLAWERLLSRAHDRSQ